MGRRWVFGRALALAAAVLAAGMPVTPAAAGKPHEHGVARLDIAVEPARITLLLETPLDNIVGFERAPRSDAERAAADAAIARLKAADVLVRPDGAGGCKLAGVTIVAPALGLGGTPTENDAHAELEAQIEFRCSAGARAGFVELGLFEAFARLARIELQMAGPRGQLKATLKRPQSRVALVR